MSILEELEAQGCNITEGLERLMNKPELYIKMLKKFPANIYGDDTKPSLAVIPYIDSKDIETAVKNAHTIKGVSGNLSLTPIYEAYTDITNLLREGKAEDARDLTVKTQPVLDKIIEIINRE